MERKQRAENGWSMQGKHKAIINKSSSGRAVCCCTNSVSEVYGWIVAGKKAIADRI